MKSKIDLSAPSLEQQQDQPQSKQDEGSPGSLGSQEPLSENIPGDPQIREQSSRKVRLYVDDGKLDFDFQEIGTVDVWKRDGLSQGYIYLDRGWKIVQA